MAENKPRPKAPSAHDDFAEIRRRRDEIQRDEGKPAEEKPKDDPKPLTGIFFRDDPVREWVRNAGCNLVVPPTWKGLVDPEWMKEVWRIMNEPCVEPSGIDFSEGEE